MTLFGKAKIKVLSLRKILSNMCELHSLCRRVGWGRVVWLAKFVEEDLGHAQSFFLQCPVDSGGKELPWYTYPAIEYLSQLDLSGCTVFEYGCGYSSFFYAKRCLRVFSVEDDQSWFYQVNARRLPNQHLALITDHDKYVSAIKTFASEYDIIVIDGSHRYECARLAIQVLRPGAFIILDNSDWFPKTSSFLRDSGLLEVDFKGLGPVNYYSWCTSFYFTRSFIPKLLNGRMPTYGIGSLKQISE